MMNMSMNQFQPISPQGHSTQPVNIFVEQNCFPNNLNIITQSNPPFNMGEGMIITPIAPSNCTEGEMDGMTNSGLNSLLNLDSQQLTIEGQPMSMNMTSGELSEILKNLPTDEMTDSFKQLSST